MTFCFIRGSGVIAVNRYYFAGAAGVAGAAGTFTGAGAAEFGAGAAF